MKYILEQLGDETLILRGSPPTLVRIKDNSAYIVDPGFGKERGTSLRKLLDNLGVEEITVILTHSHNDHIQATSYLKASHVYAPLIELPQIHYSKIRSYISYGYMFTKGLSLLEGDDIVSCKPIESRKSYGGFIPIKLPGHTFGHCGILTEDDVLYVSDALFGDKLLTKVGIPYVEDHTTFLESLDKIIDFSKMSKVVVLGHGPRISDWKILKKIIDLNKERIRNIEHDVLEYLSDSFMHIEELVSKLLIKYGVEVDLTSLLLSKPLIKSIISKYYREGKLKPSYYNGFLKWKVK